VRYRDQELRLEEQSNQLRARVGAGAPMAGTARRLARRGFAGLEWAEGLPGTIGGAVFGNAGCYGGDIASALTRAWLLVDGAVEEWPLERLRYGYRTSALKENANGQTLNAKDTGLNDAAPSTQPFAFSLQPLAFPIVLAAEFRLLRAEPDSLAEHLERTAAIRKSKTPWGSSCGSVFKNPPGDSAGRLIEAAGLKGTRAGQAQIAEKHANYIVNLGGASSDDVLRLMEIAQSEVLRQFGVELQLEVQLI